MHPKLLKLAYKNVGLGHGVYIKYARLPVVGTASIRYRNSVVVQIHVAHRVYDSDVRQSLATNDCQLNTTQVLVGCTFTMRHSHRGTQRPYPAKYL